MIYQDGLLQSLHTPPGDPQNACICIFIHTRYCAFKVETPVSWSNQNYSTSSPDKDRETTVEIYSPPLPPPPPFPSTPGPWMHMIGMPEPNANQNHHAVTAGCAAIASTLASSISHPSTLPSPCLLPPFPALNTHRKHIHNLLHFHRTLCHLPLLPRVNHQGSKHMRLEEPGGRTKGLGNKSRSESFALSTESSTNCAERG